jgi:glucose-1-phosphate cytidylyltransferase
VLRPEIFDELVEGEDLVPDALARLVKKGKVIASRYHGFWRAADTFKDRVELAEMFRLGHCPWMVWDPARRGSS